MMRARMCMCGHLGNIRRVYLPLLQHHRIPYDSQIRPPRQFGLAHFHFDQS